MTILLTLLVFVLLALIFRLAHAGRVHGLDGLLYLASAELQAIGDGVREYNRVRVTYIAQALSYRSVAEQEAE